MWVKAFAADTYGRREKYHILLMRLEHKKVRKLLIRLYWRMHFANLQMRKNELLLFAYRRTHVFRTNSQGKVGNCMADNLRRVAQCIARCRNKEKVKVALLFFLEPCVQQSNPVDQKIGISVADVLSAADITAINK